MDGGQAGQIPLAVALSLLVGGFNKVHNDLILHPFLCYFGNRIAKSQAYFQD